MSRIERKIEAEKHTKLMNEKYKADITYSVVKSVIYDENSSFDNKVISVWDTNIEVVKMTTQDAIEKFYNKDLKMCILNFASYKNPGGGYLGGSLAQEESLCSDSFLYNVLSNDRFMKEFYLPNRKDLNGSLYRNKAIYTPSVLFDDKYNVDVITCAAPNVGAYYDHKYEDYSIQKVKSAQVERIRLILNIAKQQGVDTLILGAFGCGVFGNKVEDIATTFRDCLADKNFKFTFRNVIFAVPDGGFYNEFNKIFKKK